MPEVCGTVITYCTNIHPGESWEEVYANLKTHFLAVKNAIAPHEPFPIGLRLSNRTAMEIDEKASHEFCDWCQKENCFVPTINGFPYGDFHSSVIKDHVYLPDWRSTKRSEYTKRLAALLDQWLPEDVIGSISTVPVGFGTHIRKEDQSLVRRNLVDVLDYIHALKQKSGKEIILALEPEPGCVLETIRDAVTFLEQMGLPERLQNCIGICLDCCHQAVEFEDPSEAIKLLYDSGIRLGKVQLSSAVRLPIFDRMILEQLCEPTYLHQVVVKQQNGRLSRYNDIPEALHLQRTTDGEEWRIHFHVPIFVDGTEKQGTTQFFLKEILPLIDERILLEVETYTWEILPPALKDKTVAESIIREIQWARALRNETDRCS
jgi:hypothetical protein